jgi:hypothetical protein
MNFPPANDGLMIEAAQILRAARGGRKPCGDADQAKT